MLGFRCHYFVIFLIKLIFFFKSAIADEIHGCGGFIKSHADIDFSKVEIKLHTKQGSLKDKTDCSPSNGYYFLPIYDKGEYRISVSPPAGWSFEPEQVELNFDGKNDICSKGNDINFTFKGFGITGKVSFAGDTTEGARNVDVELTSKDGSSVRRTITDRNGIFSFTPIIPGTYVIRAFHPTWHFSKSEYTVVVVSGNTELPENSLIVSGFDVIGHFESNDQLINIGIALFRKKNNKKLPLKCKNANSVTLNLDNPAFENSSVCYVQIDKSGDYKFKGVAPGNYIVKPVLEDVNLNVHISPGFLNFEVTNDMLELKEYFKITGLSVSGHVLASPDGPPLSGATIKLNGQEKVQTDANGYYILENIKTGTYTLQVEAPSLHFDEKLIKIQFSTPTLETVVPNSYKVCGTVISKKSHVIGILDLQSKYHVTTSSKAETGEWCTYLSRGTYSVEVLTTDADKANGIHFYPVQQNVKVISQPVSSVVFSQLRAALHGELKCLPDAPKTCTSAEITLQALDSSGQITSLKLTVNAINGKYSFKDVLPGPYEITISQNNLCFDSTRVFVNVASTTEKAPPFIQRGYEISIISSHRAIMKYSYESDAGSLTPSDTLKLLAGVNTFCVHKFGLYSLKLEGCHIFDENIPKTFTTSDTNPIIITAIAHKIGVRVLLQDSKVDNLQLLIESEKNGKHVITLTVDAHKVDGKFAYRYDTYLKAEEIVRITPKSDVLLFTPQSKDIVGANDCIDIAFTFYATRGLILRGKVLPAIKDVRIILKFSNNLDLKEQNVLTSTTGEFKFGPIDENLSYELFAEKESYVFSSYNYETATFKAQKLCEIIVKVKDEVGQGLSGVLLSLSGAESYRKNLLTNDEGSINFHSLSPSQYYMRPMMKEYKFEPNSKMIDIKDGETIEVELIGKRVAYSVFGIITNLNSEPFSKVNVEAVANEACSHHQEEATSDIKGQYRLRGLQTGCTYSIRLKDASKRHSNVARSIPKSRSIKVAKEDLRGINLISISPMPYTDVIVRIMTTLNDHYKTLRLVMFRKGAADSPVYSQRVEIPLNPKSSYNPGIMVYLPRIPLDDKTYIVELKTSLSDKTYTYVLQPHQFVANTSSVFIELFFKPEVRTAEGDINQNSISALILVALLSIAFFKQDIAVDFFNFVCSKADSIFQDISQKQKNNNKKDLRKNEPINQKEIEQMAEQINAIKKKKAKKI